MAPLCLSILINQANFFLLGPVAALLMVAAAEMLIDLLIVGGTSAVCAVAAGSIGLMLFRKLWRRPNVVHQSEGGNYKTPAAAA